MLNRTSVSMFALGGASVVAVVVSVFGCADYGYRANIANGAQFTIAQVAASFALVLPGLLIFMGLPVVVASLITGFASRALCKRITPLDKPRNDNS